MVSRILFAWRSLRFRLLGILVAVLLALAGGWVLAACVAGQGHGGDRATLASYERLTVQGTGLQSALQRERLSTAVTVSARDGRGRTDVVAGRAATDKARATFRTSVPPPGDGPAMRERLGDLMEGLDGLAGLRTRVDSGSVDAVGAIHGYDTVIDSLDRFLGGLVMTGDPDAYAQEAAVDATGTAYEMMAREDALVTAALASEDRRLPAAAYTLFTQSANSGRHLFDTGVAGVRAGLRGPLERLAASPDLTALRGVEDAIIDGGPGASLTPQETAWRAAVTPLSTSWPRTTGEVREALSADVAPDGGGITSLAYAAGAVGLLALVVALLLGRGLLRELRGLQRAAEQVATERLPSVVGRLRAGETVDVAAEAPPIQVGRSTEARRIAGALSDLQRIAVEAAAGEARLRGGVNKVFLNLAWRSQALLQRQLEMLDGLERQATDPDALQSLFALDHLATRMRRHADGLVILSGAAPTRGWHEPVVVRDVLRAAIAEVEDYARVVVDTASPAALDGGAVADITHLLAELIENATVFSPPATQVHIHGQMVSSGYAIDIEDRGIGMNADELAEANGRLLDHSNFDLADSDRLGLFIAGRLAERHRIAVELGPSPYGGTQAAVLIPLELVVRDDGSGQMWTDERVTDPGFRAGRPWETPRPPVPAPALPAVAFDADPAATTPASYPAPVTFSSDAEPRRLDAAPQSTEGTRPALPRRTRQVNLVPQLRQKAPPPTVAGNPVAARPPEEVRSLMASLQQGWRRGRAEEEPDE